MIPLQQWRTTLGQFMEKAMRVVVVSMVCGIGLAVSAEVIVGALVRGRGWDWLLLAGNLSVAMMGIVAVHMTSGGQRWPWDAPPSSRPDHVANALDAIADVVTAHATLHDPSRRTSAAVHVSPELAEKIEAMHLAMVIARFRGDRP